MPVRLVTRNWEMVGQRMAYVWPVAINVMMDMSCMNSILKGTSDVTVGCLGNFQMDSNVV